MSTPDPTYVFAPLSSVRLMDKHHSPMVIRKIVKYGFPLYVGIITDDTLSDLDGAILGALKESEIGTTRDLQVLRDIVGGLSEHLLERYPRTEGLAVVLYADKTFISSLFGDFMTHFSCKYEFIAFLQMSAHV